MIMNIHELTYWHTRTFGDGVKIHKSWQMGFISVLCIVTPFTNWLIPVFAKFIKTFWFRYEIKKR